MGADKAKWYIVHTYSGYEAMVKDSLEKLIENNNLQDTIFDIRILTEETLEEKANGKKKLVERKKFPCYVFLKMEFKDELWFMITNTRGVTGFVGPQGRAQPLSDEEVARIGLTTVAVNVDFGVGDDVQIISGTLESFCGKIVSLNDSTQKAMVNVSMFGRATDVEVNYVQIKKITPEVQA